MKVFQEYYHDLYSVNYLGFNIRGKTAKYLFGVGIF